MLSLRRASLLSLRTRALRSAWPVRQLCRAADPESAITPGSDTPVALQRRFAALDGLQMQYDNMEKLYEQKLREMEEEFHRATEHVLDRRMAIVSGESEPSDDEVGSSSFETAHLVGSEAPTAGVPAGVPGFWATAIRQCFATQDMGMGEEDDENDEPRISERDWEVLDYLVDVRTASWMPPAPRWQDVMTEEDAKAQGMTREDLDRMDAEAEDDGEADLGFSLTFRFAKANPFFEEGQDELVLYCYSHGEICQTSPESLPWKEGMDPTVDTKVKRKKRKGSNVSQRVTEEVPKLSFFRLFTVLDPQDGDDDPFYDQVAKMQEEMPMMLRENLVPYASALYIQALLNESEDDFDDEAMGEEELGANNFRR